LEQAVLVEDSHRIEEALDPEVSVSNILSIVLALLLLVHSHIVVVEEIGTVVVGVGRSLGELEGKEKVLHIAEWVVLEDCTFYQC
jgi:hypothetical protein